MIKINCSKKFIFLSALLPIKNNTASIVWTESIQNASTISEMNDTEYLSILQNRFGSQVCLGSLPYQKLSKSAES